VDEALERLRPRRVEKHRRPSTFTRRNAATGLITHHCRAVPPAARLHRALDRRRILQVADDLLEAERVDQRRVARGAREVRTVAVLREALRDVASDEARGPRDETESLNSRSGRSWHQRSPRHKTLLGRVGAPSVPSQEFEALLAAEAPRSQAHERGESVDSSRSATPDADASAVEQTTLGRT
jgi:hypothetical protein